MRRKCKENISKRGRTVFSPSESNGNGVATFDWSMVASGKKGGSGKLAGMLEKGPMLTRFDF